MKGVFYFTFNPNYFGDDEHLETYAFAFITSPENKNIISLNDNFFDVCGNDEYDNMVGEMEEYGVHDFSSSPCPNILGIGYHTYEVEVGKICELMHKWRSFIQMHLCTETITPVVKIEYAKMNDEQIYDEVIKIASVV